MITDQLTRALTKLGIPVVGVSIGKEADRTTWRIDYQASATAPQRATGDALLQTFDAATDPEATPQKFAQGTIDSWPIETRALVLALIDQLNVIRAALPVPLAAITPSQAIAAIRAKAATL